METNTQVKSDATATRKTKKLKPKWFSNVEKWIVGIYAVLSFIVWIRDSIQHPVLFIPGIFSALLIIAIVDRIVWLVLWIIWKSMGSPERKPIGDGDEITSE